jgi:glycosyltransferase involved in cell wall biosynthesis
MTRFAYLFERFPSFGQTFCYREVAELDRQDITPPIFSIRKPKDEPPQDWDIRIVQRVQYLPGEKELLEEVQRAAKKRKLGMDVVAALDQWGRRTDFLRLYQAVYIGLRLREMGIGHIHAHFAGMAARTAFWINKFFPITFSFTAHANDIFVPTDFEVGLDKLVDTARAIITETDYAAQFLRERFPDRGGHVHRIYNGLDLSHFGRTDFSSVPPLIIAVGRLIPKKGFGDLVRACALLAQDGKSFQCEIIGEGPAENDLRKQIEQLGLQRCVVLAGTKPQSQLRRHLAAANVFVLPSVIDPDGGMDNLPTVIMEAMATGLPVVSTNIGGIPEMVIEDETGFLVQPGDALPMAKAIDRIIADPSVARSLGQSGYDRARGLFSIDKNVRELCTLLT